MTPEPEVPQSATDDPVILRVKDLAAAPGMKLNLGCGTDYREGFVNVDGSDKLPRVDRVLDVSRQPLAEAFGIGVAQFVLAQDILEHVHHWEAVAMLEQIAAVLRPGGGAQIRVPDCEHIIFNDDWSIEEKLTKMFGGHDVPGKYNRDMDESRKAHPEYFCHRYGWTMRRMRDDVLRLGFDRVACRRSGSNFVTYALKAEV